MSKYKIVIPGDCPPKKNDFDIKWWKYDANIKQRIPLNKVEFKYSARYYEWAREAIGVIKRYKKTKQLPKEIITDPVILTVLFFKPAMVGDVANLLQGIQDVLAGNSGIHSATGYQVLKDDSCKYVRLLGGTSVIVDKHNPRTEVFITPYTKNIHKQIIKITLE